MREHLQLGKPCSEDDVLGVIRSLGDPVWDDSPLLNLGSEKLVENKDADRVFSATVPTYTRFDLVARQPASSPHPNSVFEAAGRSCAAEALYLIVRVPRAERVSAFLTSLYGDFNLWLPGAPEKRERVAGYRGPENGSEADPERARIFDQLAFYASEVRSAIASGLPCSLSLRAR